MKALNLLDKVYRYLQPAKAVSRVGNRARLDAMVREYEATESTRLRRKKEDARSPDQINETSVTRLRLQARNLDENHDLAKSVLHTLVNNVVGDGIRTLPQMKNKNGELLTDVNKRIALLWGEWQRSPEVTGEHSWLKVQRLVCRTWLRDGEAFTQRLLGNVAGLDHGSAVAYSIEMLEPDNCPVGYTDAAKNVKQGVGKNAWGKPTQYYFYSHFPSELINGMNVSLITDPRALHSIPAQNISHIKYVERINQTRGISIFASVFKRLDDLKDYEESERIAARIAAAFAMAITKNFDAPPGATSSPNWREMDLAPGIIADNLQPGEKIESIKNDRPSNALKDFRDSQLRAVAGGTQSNYSSIAKTYEGSYSSQRQELIEGHGAYTALRGEFVHMLHYPTYKDFVDVVRIQGLADFSQVDDITLYDAEYVGRGIPYIQPAQEVAADEVAIQAGIKSRTQVILEKGGDPEKVNELLIKEKEFAEENDITFSTSNGGVVPPAPVGDNTELGGGSGGESDAPTKDEDEERGDDAVMLKGQRGRRGQRGAPPAHKFNEDGTMQFQLPNGDWGAKFKGLEVVKNG